MHLNDLSHFAEIDDYWTWKKERLSSLEELDRHTIEEFHKLHRRFLADISIYPQLMINLEGLHRDLEIMLQSIPNADEESREAETINALLNDIRDILNQRGFMQDLLKIFPGLSAEEKKAVLQLTSFDRGTRIGACMKLAELKCSKAVPLLEWMLKDPEPQVVKIVIRALYFLTKNPRYHMLYTKQAESDDNLFFDKNLRRRFEKSGGKTVVLGGSLVGNVIIKTIRIECFEAWRRALEAEDLWKRYGFEMIVGENKDDGISTVYYFYVEIG